MLTQRQQAVVGAGIVCLASLAAYVPWVYTLNASGGAHRERSAGYRFIFDPPPPEKEHAAYGVRLDVPRIAVPMAVVVLITGTAFLLLGGKQQERVVRQGLADEGTNDAESLSESQRCPPHSRSNPPLPPPGPPAGATGSEEAPVAAPDTQQSRSDALFWTTIAVVAIWGVCRAIFGRGFGGLCEGFLVILIGSLVGPRVARSLSSAPPSDGDCVKGAPGSSGGEPPAATGELRTTPRGETDGEGGTRTDSPTSVTGNKRPTRSAVDPPDERAAGATRHSVGGVFMSLVFVAAIGSTAGVTVVVLSKNAVTAPTAPALSQQSGAGGVGDNPILALLSNKRGYDTPTERLDYDAIIRREDGFIRRDPNDTHAYHIRGFAWLEKKEYARAVEDFTHAICSHPQHAEAGARAFSFINRGTARLEKGDTDEAIRDFDEALRLSPGYAYARSRRANAWSDKGEYAKAVQDYDEAIQLDREYRFEDYINLAWLLATCPADEVRDGSRALRLAVRACEISDWKSGWALTSLAAAHAEKGLFAEAERYQTKALDDPAYGGPAGDEFRLRQQLYRLKQPFRAPVQHQHPTGRQPPFRAP